MHEALFDDSFLKGTGVTTLDFAKAMIDEGYHPMTMYFPLVVHGAMLIEPTESERRAAVSTRRAPRAIPCCAGRRRSLWRNRRWTINQTPLPSVGRGISATPHLLRPFC
jgi:hypothetical protein